MNPLEFPPSRTVKHALSPAWHRVRQSLLLGVAASGFLAVAQGQDAEYLGRLGFYGTGYFSTSDNFQSSEISDTNNAGYVMGLSQRFNGSSFSGNAAWIANAATGLSLRIGFTDTEFTNSVTDEQDSFSSGLTESGYAYGSSTRYADGAENGNAVWHASALTGDTVRIGLYSGTEFSSSSDRQESTALSITESGYIRGTSQRYAGASGNGQAAWVASVATGTTTTRIGLYGEAEFTRSTDDFQSSSVDAVTENGYLRGSSNRYNGAVSAGQAAWVANASTGTTTRIGLYNEAEFTNSSNNSQSSTALGLTESGYLRGFSNRFSGANAAGRAEWVALASTGTTTRVGLFDGAEFTSTTNDFQSSTSQSLTESGYVRGYSLRYAGAADAGRAAWSASAVTGETTRIGLYDGPEFTSTTNGFQYSMAEGLIESGYAQGYSRRYSGATQVGQATWIANVATGTTTRIGFYGDAEFTSSLNDSESSTVQSFTESGYARGFSTRYNGAATAGFAAWVATASTGTTTRIGFYGAGYEDLDNGTQDSSANILTESGYVSGASTRYGVDGAIGSAAWVANAATGITTRVGLFTGTTYTNSATGFQSSSVQNLTESGYLAGLSSRFNGSADTGNAAWAAKADGTTYLVGVTDAAHTRNDGYQDSEIYFATEEGYVGGASIRYDDADTAGQTAWLFDITSEEQITFDLSVRVSDNYGYSTIFGVTAEGLAYGQYSLFDGNTDLGARVFLWSQATGTILLDEAISGGVAQYGWSYLGDTFPPLGAANLLTGYGVLDGAAPGSQGIYAAQVVPEPSTYLLLILGGVAVLSFGRRRSR